MKVTVATEEGKSSQIEVSPSAAASAAGYASGAQDNQAFRTEFALLLLLIQCLRRSLHFHPPSSSFVASFAPTPNRFFAE